MPLFFVTFYAYVFWVVDPALQYHALTPIFFTHRTFFDGFTGYPGGLLDYGTGLLLQFYAFPWLGALLTTSVAGLLYLTSAQLLRQFGAKQLRVLPFLPPVLLLLIQSRYHSAWMSSTLALLVSLLAALVYAAVPLVHTYYRFLAFSLMSLPLYYLSAGGYELWALLIALIELRRGGRTGLGLAILVTAACVPGLARTFFFVISRRDAYAYLLPLVGRSRTLPMLALWLTPLLSLGLVWLVPRLEVRWPRLWARLRWAGHPLLWIILATAGLSLTYDGQAKRALRLATAAEQGRWDRVLAAGAGLTRYDPAAIADLDRALVHTGQMLSSMFAFPQKQGIDLWVHFHSQVDSFQCLKVSQISFELGQVNQAQRLAAESLELNGYRPAALQQMFLISVVKDEPDTARVYLDALAQTLWYRRWAERYRRALAVDPALTGDAELQRVRSVMIHEDYIGAVTTETLLQQLLRRNARNRFAFDYLMAHYLLTSQLGKVVQYLGRLNNFDYPEIPRHLGEALLLYQKLHPSETLDLGGRKIRPATLELYQRFNQQFLSYQGNLTAAQAGLARDFGGTYWFYFLFDRSGPPTGFHFTPALE